METTLWIFVVCGILLSGMTLGLVIPMIFDVRSTMKVLRETVVQFDDITRKASEANNSMAAKILQLEEKISNAEFWKMNAGKK